MSVSAPPRPSHRLFAWLRDAPAPARRALLAASLGWMLDSFDIMLYALVLPAVMASLHLSKPLAGVLGSITLIAAAFGGIFFGVAADRWGRTRALMGSVLLYAIFTAACGLAWSFASLAICRVLLGFGMGGEWATGAALVSETWGPQHREKALGLMQSAFAVGYGLAAIVALVVLPIAGWRGVFFVGVLPALLTVWVRRRVPESEAWRAAVREVQTLQTAEEPQRSARQGLHGANGSQAAEGTIGVRSGPNPALGRAFGGAFGQTFGELFRAPLLPRTVALTLMNACCLFAWWGFNLWVPSYLSLPSARGGIGFAPRTMTLIVVIMQVGMWCGYISFGYIATALGRKRVYVSFLLGAAALLMVFARARSPWMLLLLGPSLAFAATGYFSGFAAVTAETYPTRIRATAQGFTYNLGRLASAAAPFTAGSIAQRHGFASAFHLDAAAFLLAAALWIFLP